MAHRYGAAGRRARLLAQGIDDEPLRPRRPRPAARVEIAFEWEETELDRLLFALKMLADQLAARLERGYAVEALQVTWRLSNGEQRTALLRLAEPAGSAAVFMEHLRWHAEGLDRFLAPAPGPGPSRVGPDGRVPGLEPSGPNPEDAGLEPSGPNPEPPDPDLQPLDLAYEPLEQRLGVAGIVLEAVGIQLPGGTPLKLLASPLQQTQWGGVSDAGRFDPATRAQQARRAIARLQARWGQGSGAADGVVWQAALAASRLPERAFRSVEPRIGPQIEPQVEPQIEDISPRPLGERLPAGEAPLATQPPLWLVDPPQVVRVLPSKRKGGRPLLGLGARGRARRIVRWCGPWRLVDPSLLATQEPLRREYYQVETENGRVYLVFWDRGNDAWFLQGIFD